MVSSFGTIRTRVGVFVCFLAGFIFLSYGDEMGGLAGRQQLGQEDSAFAELEKEAARGLIEDAPVPLAESDGQTPPPNEYREALRRAQSDREQALRRRQDYLAKLGPDAAPEQKEEIEKEYQGTLALIELELEYAKLKPSLLQDAGSAESTSSAVYPIRGLNLEGNTLLSTDELLDGLPVVYEFQDSKSETSRYYDFYGFKRAIYFPDEFQEVTQGSIEGLTRYVLSRYKERGYGGIYVYVPAEIIEEAEDRTPRLKEDLLTVRIIEGEVSDVKVEYYTYDPNEGEIPYRPASDDDRTYLKESLVKAWSPIQEGEWFSQQDLDDFRHVLNLSPDRYVLPVVARGTEPNALELVYRIYETSPWHFYIKSDNSGSDERKWNPTFGLFNTNLAGRDDRLTAIYQGPIHEHPCDPTKENYSVYSSYDTPLFSPYLRLTLYAGHSNFDTTTDFSGGQVNFLGSGDFYGSILRWHLFQFDDPISPETPWFFDLTGSVSHEISEVNPTVGVDTDVWWNAWAAGCSLYRSQRADEEAYTSFSFERYSSFDGSDSSRFQDARTDADTDFTIHSVSAAHSQFLSDKQIHKVLASVRWVWPDERLVPAKMTSFGGLYTVRGYEEDEIIADGGTLLSAQYEFDIIKYLQRDKDEEENGLIQRLAFLTFADWGRAKNREPVPGEEKIQELASVGWGLKSELLNSFDAAFYYGLPLRSAEDTDREDGRWHFAFLYRMNF